VDKEDLVQEGMLAVSRAGGYDPAKSRPTSFVYMVASRTMLDLWRSKSRQAARDVAAGRSDVTTEHPGQWADPSDLVDWCRRIRAAARAIYGSRPVRIGPRFYSLDRVAALVMLQARQGVGRRVAVGAVPAA
jgi:DNA-directed RNA polymerase specialized sigma24 family protein